MESFQGSLAHYRLGFIVPALCEPVPATGALLVERGSICRTFWLQEGSLVAVSSREPREHLAQVVADQRLLSRAEAARAFSTSSAAGVPLGAFLVETGLVAREEVERALVMKAREALFDCYEWESGELAFNPDAAPAARFEFPLGLSLKHLHQEALAASREWRVFREVFPRLDVVFTTHPEAAADATTEEDDELLSLAASGRSISELLALSPEGRTKSARRLLRLYRRGVLTNEASAGERVGESPDLSSLLAMGRALLRERAFDSAEVILAEALSRGSAAEAHQLYREVEAQRDAAIAEDFGALEHRFSLRPLGRELPSELTADDVYLYHRLVAANGLVDGLRTAAMGEAAAYRSLMRLIAARLVVLDGDRSQAP